MKDLNILFSPYQLTDKITLSNRIVMAPMTRSMAKEDFTPTQEMAEYYGRRADAGLIITEGTVIRPDGTGYPTVPGIFTQKHIDAWKKVTSTVHAKGGKIANQIWHVGRVSHPHFLNGALPIGPSATKMQNRVPRMPGLFYGESRAVTLDEIKVLIEDFIKAGENAIKAGFDLIELHGANGYLIDQFLHHHTNHRKDEYGGSPENMARFVLEIINGLGDVIGYDKIGIRLSPGAYLNEIVGDPKDAEVFKYLLLQLNELNIAFVDTGNFDDSVTFPELGNKTMTAFMREFYKGNLIATGGYTYETAIKNIENNEFDLVSLGRPFIANPNLIEKLSNSDSLTNYDVNMLEMLY